MLRYFETVRGVEGGHSVNGYIEYFARDFFTNLTLAERRQVIAAGENFPTSALSILAKLPENPGPDVLAEIRALDQRLDGQEGEADRPAARRHDGRARRAAASRNRSRTLRDVYQNDPDRRSPVAMSLTQHPDGENWDVLVDSLRTVDGIAAPEVLAALARSRSPAGDGRAVSQRDSARPKQTPSAGDLAVKLLEHWTGQPTRRATHDRRRSNSRRGRRGTRASSPMRSPAELPQGIRTEQVELRRAARRIWKAPKARRAIRRAGRTSSRRPSASSATASTARAKASGPISRRSASGSSGRKFWSRSCFRRTWCPTNTRARS